MLSQVMQGGSKFDKMLPKMMISKKANLKKKPNLFQKIEFPINGLSCTEQERAEGKSDELG